MQAHQATVYLSLRCRAICPDDHALRARVREVHPEIDFARVFAPAEADYRFHLRLPAAMADLGGLFAIVAILSAAGGLFSVLTYAVGRRRREFGIRVALGAAPHQMRRIVFRDLLGVVVPGLACGALGGWLVARSLGAFEYGVSANDVTTWVPVIGTLTLAALAAAWRPARQAARVDPVRLLREE
jgi:hypothetical protein